MNIHKATKSYESWMRSSMPVVNSDLSSKHSQMRKSLFLFPGYILSMGPTLAGSLLRAVRRTQSLSSWRSSRREFGTGREAEGRIFWGVDDFDESYALPYTSDLVRLAASVKIGIDSAHLVLSIKDGCDAILEGYQETLKKGGCPFVLAENEQYMEKLGIEAIKPPEEFWGKLTHLPAVHRGIPQDAKRALESPLPQPRPHYQVVRRRAGLGSLGQHRFVAIANWEGGHIAREAKAMLPSAYVWLTGRLRRNQSFYGQAIQRAVRSRDPFQKIEGAWLIRRLSPESNPIEIAALSKRRDEEKLLHAMGSEAANVHLGSRRAVSNIRKDLQRRKPNWLRSAAREMAKVTERDWKKYLHWYGGCQTIEGTWE